MKERKIFYLFLRPVNHDGYIRPNRGGGKPKSAKEQKGRKDIYI